VACSICREKGHDKRQCPTLIQKQEEVFKIRQDRINILLRSAPQILANPIAQGLLWFYISDKVPLLDSLNKIIVGTETLSLVPTVDTASFPQGVILGAFMQETKDLKEYVEKIKGTGQEEAKAFGASSFIRYLEEGIKFLFAEESPFPEYDPVTGEKYGETIE